MEEEHTELASSRFRVRLQQFVYDSIEIHQAGVLPQVVLWFSEENIRLAIASSYANFPWLRQRTHDLDFVVEIYKSQAQNPGK